MSKVLKSTLLFFKKLLLIPQGLIGFLILLVLGLIGLLAPAIAPYNPWRLGEDIPYQPPSEKHILGTNDVGVDIFSELLFGARVSLMIGVLAGFFSVVIGTFIGLLGGFYGGIVSRIVMRITDIFLILPAIPLAILLTAIFKPSIWNVITAIIIVSWPPAARQIYAQTLSLKEEPFVEAAKALGASSLQIMVKHILPNLYPLVIANIVLMSGSAMLMEAGLSFLGLGDPTQRSWGMMLYYAQMSGAYSRGMWWWLLPPGFLIGLTTLGFTLTAQALEEILSPRLSKG